MSSYQNADQWKDGTEGLFIGLPAEVYHKASGVNHSMLKNSEPVARLPEYLREKRKPSAAMIMGTLVHQSILEPALAWPQIVIREDDEKKPGYVNYRTKEGRAWRDAQTLPILTPDEVEDIKKIVSSVQNHEFCNRIFSKGESEVSGFVRDGIGMLRKFRMDFIPVGNALVDIKTCAFEVDRDSFSKVLYNERYYSQAAWYLDCWNLLMPSEPRHNFIFIAVEKKPPFLVALYYLNDEDWYEADDGTQMNDGTIEAGRRRNESNLAAVAQSHATKIWPGFPVAPQRIQIPSWAKAKEFPIE